MFFLLFFFLVNFLPSPANLLTMETAFASSPRLLPSAASSIDLEQPFNDRKKATSALTPAFAKYFYVSAVCTTPSWNLGYLRLTGDQWCFIVVGTVVGRALEKLNWCWAFYINFVVGGILAPLYLFLLPSVDPSPDTQYAKRLPRPDYIGAILLVGALNSLLVAISFGGTKYAWNSRQTIALFCVSGVLFLIYAIQQRLALLTTTADRMLRVHSFNKKALLLFILAAACNAAAFIPIYYLSTYFQFTSGDLVEDSHVRALPVRCVLSVTILVNQFLMLKFGYYQSWFLYTGQGSLAYLAVTILRKFLVPAKGWQPIYDQSTIAYIDRNSVWRRNYGTEIVHIIGTGAYISAGYAVVQAVVDPVDISYAITFMLIGRPRTPDTSTALL